jgi:hypothetical protein
MALLKFFIGLIPSVRIMTLGSTQPLKEMSIRNISWGECSRCLGLKNLRPSRADCLEIWEPQTYEPAGPLRGLGRDRFTLYCVVGNISTVGAVHIMVL